MILVVDPTAARAWEPTVSDDEAVYGVVELLKEISDHKRNREHDEKFRDGTGCHVHGFLFFRGMVHSGFSLA